MIDHGQTFALRLGASGIFWRDAQPSRVGDIGRATPTTDKDKAVAQAAFLGLAWRVVPVDPDGEDEAH